MQFDLGKKKKKWAGWEIPLLVLPVLCFGFGIFFCVCLVGLFFNKGERSCILSIFKNTLLVSIRQVTQFAQKCFWKQNVVIAAFLLLWFCPGVGELSFIPTSGF